MTRHVPLSYFRRSKGRMFKSVDYVMTYIQGCGTEDTLREGRAACPYCWTQFLPFGAISRQPRLVWEDPHAKIPDKIRDATIFLNSAHDTFAPVIPTEWINEMMYWMRHQDPSITFYLQSKWIHRARDHAELTRLNKIKTRVILGTTLETSDQQLLDAIGCKAPPVQIRAEALGEFAAEGYRTRLSLEPLFDFTVHRMMELIKRVNPETIEIGLDNYQKDHGLIIPQPSKAKILTLTQRINQETQAEIFEKGSLKAYLKEAKK